MDAVERGVDDRARPTVAAARRRVAAVEGGHGGVAANTPVR